MEFKFKALSDMLSNVSETLPTHNKSNILRLTRLLEKNNVKHRQREIKSTMCLLY